MERPCDDCGKTYTAQRSTSRFCSPKCRIRSHGKVGTRPSPPVSVVKPRPGRSVEAATLKELDAANQTQSAAGQQALALAVLIDDPQGALGSVAGWAREHRAAMAEALRVEIVPQSTSLADQLKVRRDAKRGA